MSSGFYATSTLPLTKAKTVGKADPGGCNGYGEIAFHTLKSPTVSMRLAPGELVQGMGCRVRLLSKNCRRSRAASAVGLAQRAV